MSVQEFLVHQSNILALLNSPAPECWIIIANSVHYEGSQLIALFDTCVQAEAYVEASLLPEEFMKAAIDGKWRSFRPDSLLWESNLHPGDSSKYIAACAASSRFSIVYRLSSYGVLSSTDLTGLPFNPPTPFGPLPAEPFASAAAKALVK